MDGGEGRLSLRILLRDPSGSPLSSGLAQNAPRARFVEPSSRVLMPLFFHAQKSARWAPFLCMAEKEGFYEYWAKAYKPLEIGFTCFHLLQNVATNLCHE